MQVIRRSILLIFICIILWFGGIMMMNILSHQWYTKSQSQTVEIAKEQEDLYFLPEEIMQTKCVQFIVQGIEDRKTFNDTLKSYSEKLGLDYDLVISAILWEQIRISCKGVRGVLKDTILNTTPTLFRSYDVSVWIAGIKLWTARKIRTDALAYGYGDDLKNVQITEAAITNDDVLSAKLATLLVKNIVHRWALSWIDLSHNAWVVWTLYNMWNPLKKVPHEDPKIWGSVIKIDDQEFVYGEISLAMYNYLKQKKKNLISY